MPSSAKKQISQIFCLLRYASAAGIVVYRRGVVCRVSGAGLRLVHAFVYL